MPRWLIMLLLILLPGSVLTGPTLAQVNDVMLQLEPGDVGLNGLAMAGQWTPMRLTLNNQSADVVAVECRWVLNDLDGDRIIAERSVTLNPLTPTVVWLYAPIPTTQSTSENWTIQVIDEKSREIITAQSIRASVLLDPAQSTVIGVLGGQTMKLRDFDPDQIGPVTGHEPITIHSNLVLDELPDRWYGLSMLRTLVWTPLGGDPGQMPPRVQRALRTWVERGGHLVLVMPHVGEPWSGSALSDLLPVEAKDMRRVERFDLLRLGTVQTTDLPRVPALVFDTQTPQSNTLIAENTDGTGDALVATGRYGFGRVTLVGINLASPVVAALNLPNGRNRIWNEILHANRPLFTKDYIQNQIQQGNMVSVNQRDVRVLGFFLPTDISMTGAAAVPLLLSILIFGIYWLVAGPITFGILKARNMAQYSWLAFLACVMVFSLIAWSLAYALQPHSLRIEHVSILDIDGNTDTVRTQSWFSLLIPDFGIVDVAVAPSIENNTNTLANLGTGFESSESTAYIDPQTYTFDAGRPSLMSVPARATAKSFNANYMGPLTANMPGLSANWTLPVVRKFEIVNSFPQGQIVHNLPGELHDVLIVFAPGRGSIPWVWRTDNWKPGEALNLNSKPNQSNWLVQRLPYYPPKREWKQEGFLGVHMDQGLGRSTGAGASPSVVSNDQIVRDLEALTFFDALPPPDFRDTNFSSMALGIHAYRRPLGHQTDLTHLIDGRRLIVLGHLRDSPMPMPLTVDQDAVADQTGRTLVRYLYDF